MRNQFDSETGRFEVICGNVGSVYSGNSRMAAKSTFNTYVDHSSSGYGRAAGESVTLFEDDEILDEHVGSVDQSGE
jgi:hypothetical protein